MLERQDRWDADEIILHNFKWSGIVVSSGDNRAPTPEVKGPSVADELFQPAQEVKEIPEAIEEQKLVEPPRPVETPMRLAEEPKPVEPTKPVEAPRRNTGKLRVHCLPARIIDYTDALYGQSYKTIQYGDKFIVEAGMVSQGDIQSVFWLNDDRVTPGSILYPISMDKRWWKAVEIEDRPLGGVFVKCQVSEKQPSFD